jgi:hypothetical protein
MLKLDSMDDLALLIFLASSLPLFVGIISDYWFLLASTFLLVFGWLILLFKELYISGMLISISYAFWQINVPVIILTELNYRKKEFYLVWGFLKITEFLGILAFDILFSLFYYHKLLWDDT